MFRFAVLTVTALLVAGCSAATPASRELTVADNATTQTVAVGDTVIVRLAGNPTTGYSWTQLAGDAAVLVPAAEEPAYSSEAAEGVVGAGGTYTFSWTAQAAGTTTLELAYRRPWETDVAPIETFTVTIEVR